MNIAMMIGGFVAGSLCGLVPFFVGKRKGQTNLAVIALLVCAFCGMILGILLALPAAVVFTVIIVIRANSARASAAIIAAGGPQAYSTGARICPRCSSQLGLDAHFCNACGHQFS